MKLESLECPSVCFWLREAQEVVSSIPKCKNILPTNCFFKKLGSSESPLLFNQQKMNDPPLSPKIRTVENTLEPDCYSSLLTYAADRPKCNSHQQKTWHGNVTLYPLWARVVLTSLLLRHTQWLLPRIRSNQDTLSKRFIFFVGFLEFRFWWIATWSWQETDNQN